MMRDRAAAWARIATLLLLAAVVCAQALSLAQIHSHDCSSQHCCGLCHTGPLPFVPMAMAAAGLPVLAGIWLAVSEQSNRAREAWAAAASTRAPPA